MKLGLQFDRLQKWTRDVRYDRISRRLAEPFYNAITHEQGVSPSLRKALREAEDYARQVLGSKRFLPWLNVYTAYRGEFVPGWISDNYYGRVVLPHIQGKLTELSSSKTLSRRLLCTERLPDVGYHVNGVWYDPQWNRVDPAEVSGRLYGREDQLYFKRENSQKGRGVMLIRRAEFRAQDFGITDNLVIQRPIQLNEFFLRFGSQSGATIRIITHKPNGTKTRIAGSYLRLGRSGIVRSAEQIHVPIIDQNGRLAAHGALSDWRKVTAHPETNISFEGLEVPSYRTALNMCSQWHDRLPHMGIIGWDVATNAAGEIELMEWNSDHPGIKFSEASQGPCFTGFGWEHLARTNRT